MNKKDLSERDICTKFITPAIKRAGWDIHNQMREEVGFTKGRIVVRGKLVSRGQPKRADYILYYKPNIPIAVVEAKDNKHSVGDGMQQGLDYAETLDLPYAFASNGDGFLMHDRTGRSRQIETELSLEEFPSPAELWAGYRADKGLPPEAENLVLQDYYQDPTGKEPRYYQAAAINRTVEAIAKGQQRLLLVTNSAELVGKTGIYVGEDDCQTFASYLIRIRLSANHCIPQFVNLAMNAPSFRASQIVPLIKKQTGQANVNGTALKNMLIPIPPADEQKRLVDKVDELMSVCDSLSCKLMSCDEIRGRLLDAVLQESLAADDMGTVRRVG